MGRFVLDRECYCSESSGTSGFAACLSRLFAPRVCVSFLVFLWRAQISGTTISRSWIFFSCSLFVCQVSAVWACWAGAVASARAILGYPWVYTVVMDTLAYVHILGLYPGREKNGYSRAQTLVVKSRHGHQ